MKKFDKGFLLGAATAAHQVEGNNTTCDLWAMEHMEHSTFNEPSLDAVDHYHRYAEDMQLAAQAGLNAYRFSLEWARIEPEEGVFDEAEIEHYRQMIRTCRATGLEPVVTLLHFTCPVWLIKKGGWEAATTPADFERYVRRVMEELGQDLTYVCTINEANMGTQIARIMRRFEQQARQAAERAAAMASAAANAGDGAGQGDAPDLDGNIQMGINLQKMMEERELQAQENIAVFGVAEPQTFQTARTPEGDAIVMEAHRRAVAAIRELAPHVKVGLTLSLHDIQWIPGGEQLAAEEWDAEFEHYLPALEGDDFVGVQNYARTIASADGDLPVPEGAEMTQAGYEYYPDALEHVIRKVAARFDGDIMVTENGYAGDDDERRVAFITEALAGVQRCQADGVPVKGYFYWSLLDNFEWQKGFAVRFGLISVDRATQERTAKPSLAYLGSFAPDAH